MYSYMHIHKVLNHSTVALTYIVHVHFTFLLQFTPVPEKPEDRCGRDRIVVRFTTTFFVPVQSIISAYHQ
jgi:hypothetical protein